ncbi:MAG: GAF domain-containing protein, partial [Pedobacter sp.]
SWERAEVIIVPDVDEFPGHIACAAASRSEIVLPLYHQGNIVGVLDVDSVELANFDEIDAKYLQQILDLLYD